MIYRWDILLPPNTSRASPIRQELALDPSIIKTLALVFPSGCSGLAKCYIERGGMQLFPGNNGGYFAGDGLPPIVWDASLDLYDGPYSLWFVGWNDDELYPHTLTVTIETSGRR